MKRWIKKVVYKIIPSPEIQNSSIPASYSQAGEDAIMRFLFADKKIQNISYLEIGTNSPDSHNNTYLFYLNGSRGICVEADKSLIQKICDKRPFDKVLNMGVSIADDTQADFYIFDCDALNTFDKQQAEDRAAQGNYLIKEVVKVPLISINKLIKEHFDTYPDLLSIDIEGLDFPVLQTLNFEKYPIPVICAETCKYSETHIRPKDTSLAKFMITKGYEIYGDTYINTIFINKEWFYHK